MSQQTVTAEHNFIVNGDLLESLDVGWTVNDESKVSIKREVWGGVLTPHLHVVNEGEAEQTIHLRDLPRPAKDRADYRVSFYYQATQGAMCWVSLSPGKGGEQRYDLVPSLKPDDEQQEVQESDEPLDLQLELREYLITLEPDEAEVTVSFGAPENDRPGMLRGLRVTRIKVELLLEDLRLERVILNGVSQEAADPLRLCLGAVNENAAVLTLVPADDSVWKGTNVGLLVNGQTPVPGAPISVSPGGEQTIEHPWRLSCDDLPEEEGVEHSLCIQSEFTAELYELKTLSGHFRLDIIAVQEAAYYPVMDLGQSVTLTARVLSHYTKQPLAGREVRWYLGDDELFCDKTDENGEASFEYSPDMSGNQQIIAKVDSYYHPENAQYVFAVWALQTDPWLEVCINLDELGAVIWGDKTLFPCRGGAHSLITSISDDNPIFGTSVALFWQDTPDSPEYLGVTFDPPLEEARELSVANMRWAMHCADIRNGQYSLQLESSRLKERSKLMELNLAHNWVEKGWVKEASRFPSLDSPIPLPLAIQAMSKIAGVPEAREVDVTWMSSTGDESKPTGTDGVSEFDFVPTEEGTFDVVAKVVNRYDDSSFDHSFSVTVVGEDPWNKLATLTLNNREPGAIGIFSFMGEEGTLKLMPIGNGLIDQEVYLNWPDTNPDLGLVTDPPMDQKRKLTNQGLSWKVEFTSTESARYDLQVCCDMLDPWTVPGRLLSRSIDAEGSLELDEVRFGSENGAYPCIGAQHDLWFRPKASSPLSGLQLALRWKNEPEGKYGIIFNPDLGHVAQLQPSGNKWELNCVSASRVESFSLELFFPELELVYTPLKMSLGNHRLLVWAARQAAMDPVLANNESVRLGLRLRSFYTTKAVMDAPIKFERPGTTDLEALTEEDGWAPCDYQPRSAGDLVVTASFLNRYNGESVSTPFQVTVLANDPWAGLKFEFAGDPKAEAIGVKTVFPRRGGTYTIKLIPAGVGSDMVGRGVALGLSGIGASEIGATLTPGWGNPQTMTPTGVTWTLKLGNVQDAGFGIFAAASRLYRFSSNNPASLGSVPLPVSSAATEDEAL
ncbi:hypothetical protein [Pseudomonas sp. ANT_H12B]|uniref:hypothetical protein n=1 Tax=Pseudomonas sp. ANT_H12B TaxID=2597348 RepID=UPI0011F05F24|nr:hypothetical protein [Pseudomonas sp. ANT_H12B]KAA0974854.1 hypothetical protein FQ185_09680 [Pseudomonas sp. ANT_H12B]